MNDDLISRQVAIDAVRDALMVFFDFNDSDIEPYMSYTEKLLLSINKKVREKLRNLPSAEQNVGEWDMFELITSTWYGKQCYFMEDSGIVYSRVSHEYMSVIDAIKEFLGMIGDNG